ncbi:MAG: hypothetical protein IKN29_05675, partial [Bacteroidales bacterium]|nr:hypothetical protein [Bacteroidales bacterium]
RQDDYYKDTSKELQEAGSYDALFKTGFSFDTPDVIDLALMRKHLEGLKRGETVQSPMYDFVTCESKKNAVLKKPSKFILNEGLYVLNDFLKDIVDVKIYVYTPFEIIKERWFARATSRGKTGAAAHTHRWGGGGGGQRQPLHNRRLVGGSIPHADGDVCAVVAV